MTEFEQRGNALRAQAKALVLEFMFASDLCQPGREGMRLSPIFRACGFDWGDHTKATSSNQQYWVVALMRQLEAEGRVERLFPSRARGAFALRRRRATCSETAELDEAATSIERRVQSDEDGSVQASPRSG